MNILEKIAEKTKERIEEEKQIISYEKILESSINSNLPNNFYKAFEKDGINIISEIKFASPSEGLIAEGNPVNIAQDYLNNGAVALSVLTEPQWFKGNYDYITDIKKHIPSARIIMKDFTVDEYQIAKARLIGADAVLLIVAILGKDKLKQFMKKADDLNLSSLVEVHDDEEMKIAVSSGAKLIGVNNRNLKDMSISLKTSEKLITFADKDITMISESGLKQKEELIYLKEMGYKGFLIGTSFMKSGNPGLALNKMIF